MPQEDFRELLRRVAVQPKELPVHPMTVSTIVTGRKRLRISTAEKIAQAIGLTRQEVLAAADESWRRSRPVDTATPSPL